MKLSFFIIPALAMMLAAPVKAQQVEGASVSNLSMDSEQGYMTVRIGLDLSGLRVRSNRAMLYTPRLVGENDSIDLHSVGVYGRRRYYYYVRNGESNLTGPTEESFRKSEAPDSIIYEEVLPYQDWMDGAMLVLCREQYGCCGDIIDSERDALGRYYSPAIPMPRMIYVTPKGDAVKEGHLEGTAYVAFPVSDMTIHPNYLDNQKELGKIQSTIEPLTQDADITVTHLSIKGFASPESPYSNNDRLSKGRTRSLMKYVDNLYHFGEEKFSLDNEPENWEGLREYVVKSNLKNRDAILALIDSDREPDNKEYAIKKRYPEDYKFMKDNWYPWLRRSDYVIKYTIRSYIDVEEIKRVMKEKPQNLSLNEFYLLAGCYEPGTDEYNEVFETSVRMFPTDPVANLNAANNAMQRGELESAARYLAKAGDSQQASYARAALAFLNKDYDASEALLHKATATGFDEEAKKQGLDEAADFLQQEIEKQRSRAIRINPETINNK